MYICVFVTLQGFRECMYVCLLHCRGLGKDDVYICVFVSCMDLGKDDVYICVFVSCRGLSLEGRMVWFVFGMRHSLTLSRPINSTPRPLKGAGLCTLTSHPSGHW